MATVTSKNVSWNGTNNSPWGLTAKVGPYKATVQDKLNFFNRKGGPNAGHANSFYTIRPGVFTETKQPKTAGYYADNSIIDDYDYSVQSNVPGRRGKKMSFKDNFNVDAHNSRIAIELKNRVAVLNAQHDLEKYRKEFINYHMNDLSSLVAQNMKKNTQPDMSGASSYATASEKFASDISDLNPKADQSFRNKPINNDAMLIDAPDSNSMLIKIAKPLINEYEKLNGENSPTDSELGLLPFTGGVLNNATARGPKRGLQPESLDLPGNIYI